MASTLIRFADTYGKHIRYVLSLSDIQHRAASTSQRPAFTTQRSATYNAQRLAACNA